MTTPAGERRVVSVLLADIAGFEVRLQHAGDRVAQPEVAVADDAGTGAHAGSLRLRGHAGNVFGLAHRTEFRRPVRAIGEAALNEHRGPQIVAGCG